MQGWMPGGLFAFLKSFKKEVYEMNLSAKLYESEVEEKSNKKNKKGYRAFSAFEEEEFGWFDYRLEALLDLMFNEKKNEVKNYE
jgi:hypothetical protein